ncbi:hypothetical protein QCA50_009839 [Cerrena zonata]|uniref:Uncharacterized protein n=1 Tax=Cerrena zonata TaxID=2478898 RepID=A0AAW0GBL7_9APHY
MAIDGNYPQTIEDSFPPSVLRRFTDEEKAIIIGSAEFYAIDAYSIAVAKTAPGGLEACISDMNNINWPICQDTDAVAQHTRVNGWPIGASADPLAPL